MIYQTFARKILSFPIENYVTYNYSFKMNLSYGMFSRNEAARWFCDGLIESSKPQACISVFSQPI